LNAVNLSTDRCIYVWRNSQRKLIGLCSTHVDDLKLAGEEHFVSTLLATLERSFGKLKIQHGSFEHCGILHQLQPDKSYHLTQDHFVSRMQPTDLTGIDKTNLTTPLNEKQIVLFQSGVGSLAWLIQTRLDIAIYVQALQRSAKSPTVAHMLRLSTVIKWCKRKPVFLKYTKLLTDFFKVLVCSDAAFRREDSSGLAMRGSIIGLAEHHPNDPGGRVNVIDFFSRRQRRVVRSTFGAETNSLADGIEVGRMVAFTLAEFLVPDCTAQSLVGMDESGTLPICLQAITDCKSLFDSLKAEDVQVPSEQSLIMLLLQLKEGLRTGTIHSIVWCDTRDMIADGLNKGCIARAALLQFSMTALWQLHHPFAIHVEPTKVVIRSSHDQARDS